MPAAPRILVRTMAARQQIQQAVSRALATLDVEVSPGDVHLERPARREHGDWSTNAALVNAMMGHGIELDDAHGSGLIKAGSVLVPAAFALAELTGADPGYEYVKPTPEVLAADGIIMYQLRGGKRVPSLAALYTGGAVGKR